MTKKAARTKAARKDFHDEKKSFLKQWRNRRGRLGRHEYVNVCDERCGYCGGGWGMVLGVDDKDDGADGSGRDGAAGATAINEEEEENKLTTIDVEMLDERRPS